METVYDQKDMDEDRIRVLHTWISRMCDPEINFCANLMTAFDEDDKIIVENIQLGEKGKKETIMTMANFGLVTGYQQDIQVADGAFRKYANESLIEGSFKRGLPNGFFRHINRFGDVEFFGCFINGILHGSCWKSLPGGSFLVSSSLHFCGDSVMFLYPDCRTVLVGNFYHGVMTSAKPAEVIGSRRFCNSSACPLLCPVLSKPAGQRFKFDPASRKRFSSSPLHEDPYEMQFVRVGPSTMKEAGEGLLANMDIEPGTVLSFYNGVRIDKDDIDYDEASDYSIMLDENFDIDVPPDMTDTSIYRASLAHKICHSFQPNCEFDSFFHPRFGPIRCVASIKNIKMGEELTVNYRYPLLMAPTWYKVEWAKNQKRIRSLPDWNRVLDTRGRSRGSTSSSESSVQSME